MRARTTALGRGDVYCSRPVVGEGNANGVTEGGTELQLVRAPAIEVERRRCLMGCLELPMRASQCVGEPPSPQDANMRYIRVSNGLASAPPVPIDGL